MWLVRITTLQYSTPNLEIGELGSRNEEPRFSQCVKGFIEPSLDPVLEGQLIPIVQIDHL